MPIPHPHRVDLASLVGIDGAKEELLRNTEQFVSGRGANHVLLWGERGTGKSSCVKGLLPVFGPRGLRIVELARWDLFAFPKIVGQLRDLPFRFLLFCDDLSFDEGEADFRGLKTLLDGGVEERPENVLIYATSNRRHLMPERRVALGAEDEIHPEEAVSEKLSLSDRFGLQLGFYRFDQETYLAVVDIVRAAAAPPRRTGEASGGGAAVGALRRLAQRPDGEAVHRRPRGPPRDAIALIREWIIVPLLGFPSPGRIATCERRIT